LLIHRDEIKEVGLTRTFEEPVASFPELEEMGRAGECSFLSPLHIQVRIDRVSEMLVVRGNVAVTLQFSCSRCLTDFVHELQCPFEATFVEELPDVEGDDGDEKELTPEEMGISLLQDEEINLVDIIQEQLIMAFPLRPLCKEECKGLCPLCGADLNQTTCQCAPPSGSSKFAALKDFMVEKK